MYNREYLGDSNSKEETYSSYEQTQTKPENLIGFLRATYQLFASSLMAATVGAYVGLGMASMIASCSLVSIKSDMDILLSSKFKSWLFSWCRFIIYPTK